MDIWVTSDLLPEGTYATVVHFDADRSRVLDRDAALAYAATVHVAATRADHDAAVAAQLLSLGVQRTGVAQTLLDLREDRPPLDEAAIAPLRLTPGVSVARGVGFLEVAIAGKTVGQWDTGDARSHAGHVLTALAAADLDTAYRHHLMGAIGLDKARAQAVIGDLAAHLQGEP